MDANMTTCLMRLIFISHSMRHFAQVDNILDQTHIIYISLYYLQRDTAKFAYRIHRQETIVTLCYYFLEVVTIMLRCEQTDKDLVPVLSILFDATLVWQLGSFEETRYHANLGGAILKNGYKCCGDSELSKRMNGLSFFMDTHKFGTEHLAIA